MSEMIRVEPAHEHRQCFARWAVAQEPKIRTADHNAFAVPADLFTQAPEEILIGALVDGHRYVSPDEVTVIDGVSLNGPHAQAAAREQSPDFAPLEDAPADDSDSSDPGSELPEPEPGTPETAREECPHCPREFTTARGRDTHVRLTHHAEEADSAD